MITVKTDDKLVLVLNKAQAGLISEALATLRDTKRHQPEDDDPAAYTTAEQIAIIEGIQAQIAYAPVVAEVTVAVSP